MTRRGLVLTFVSLAVGSASLGIVITFAVLLLCQYLGVDIGRSLWVLGIPALSSLLLNVLFIELFLRFGRRRR